MKKGKSILSLILVIAVTALFGMTCVLGLDLKGMSGKLENQYKLYLICSILKKEKTNS